MKKKVNIEEVINVSLTSLEKKEKYLSILHDRISENNKSMSRLFIALALIAISFPLLLNSQITDISVGPFKIKDVHIAIICLPTIFSYMYYKYIMIWTDLIEQKKAYKSLTSSIFELPTNSYLNKLLRKFSFTDSLDNYLNPEKFGFLGCLSLIILLPVGLILLVFPFVFEFYSIKTIFENLQRGSYLDWVLFILPIVISLMTILVIIQNFRKTKPDYPSA